MAGGLDSFDWLKDRIKKPKVVVDLSGIEELKGVRADRRRHRDRRHDHADRSGEAIPSSGRSTACWRRPPNWWPRRRSATRAPSAATCRRTRAAGITAAAGRVIAPAATSAMPIRRGPQPRARDSPRRPLRGRESVGHGPGADRARRQVRDAHAQGRARGGRRRLFHRSGNRHHAPAHPAARRSADGHSHSLHMGRRAILFRESARPERVGLSAVERGVGDGAYQATTSSESASP